jgi:hypothetical protein
MGLRESELQPGNPHAQSESNKGFGTDMPLRIQDEAPL